MSQLRTTWRVALLAVALLIGGGTSVRADDLVRGPRGHALVMIEDPGCPYCARWHREVGPGYRLSGEGKFAPLNVVLRASAAARRIPYVRFTPTFVLLDADREVGRIVGYGGSEMFWAQAQGLFASVGFKGDADVPAPQAPGERATELIPGSKWTMLGWLTAPVGRAHQ